MADLDVHVRMLQLGVDSLREREAKRERRVHLLEQRLATLEGRVRSLEYLERYLEDREITRIYGAAQFSYKRNK